jgi:hypothetical protein
MTLQRSALLVAALVAASLSLAACGISREEARAVDNDTCASMGLKFGSPEFAQCRLMQDQRRDNTNAAQQAHVAQTLKNFNDSVQNNRVEYPPPPVFQPMGRPGVDVYHHY